MNEFLSPACLPGPPERVALLKVRILHWPSRPSTRADDPRADQGRRGEGRVVSVRLCVQRSGTPGPWGGCGGGLLQAWCARATGLAVQCLFTHYCTRLAHPIPCRDAESCQAR